MQDVGLSRILTSDRTQMSSFQGTFEWAPPELINGGQCSAAADCYSFGVVLWCALAPVYQDLTFACAALLCMCSFSMRR